MMPMFICVLKVLMMLVSTCLARIDLLQVLGLVGSVQWGEPTALLFRSSSKLFELSRTTSTLGSTELQRNGG